MSNIGFPGLVLILIIALIVFGPNKLPELGKAFGRSLKEFKDATSGLTDDPVPKAAEATTLPAEETVSKASESTK